MYGISVRKLKDIVLHVDKLLEVAHERSRKDNDSLRSIISKHDKKMDETIDEDIRKGY